MSQYLAKESLKQRHKNTKVIWSHNFMSIFFRKAFWWTVIFQLNVFAVKTIMFCF